MANFSLTGVDSLGNFVILVPGESNATKSRVLVNSSSGKATMVTMPALDGPYDFAPLVALELGNFEDLGSALNASIDIRLYLPGIGFNDRMRLGVSLAGLAVALGAEAKANAAVLSEQTLGGVVYNPACFLSAFESLKLLRNANMSMQRAALNIDCGEGAGAGSAPDGSGRYFCNSVGFRDWASMLDKQKAVDALTSAANDVFNEVTNASSALAAKLRESGHISDGEIAIQSFVNNPIGSALETAPATCAAGPPPAPTPTPGGATTVRDAGIILSSVIGGLSLLFFVFVIASWALKRKRNIEAEELLGLPPYVPGATATERRPKNGGIPSAASLGALGSINESAELERPEQDSNDNEEGNDDNDLDLRFSDVEKTEGEEEKRGESGEDSPSQSLLRRRRREIETMDGDRECCIVAPIVAAACCGSTTGQRGDTSSLCYWRGRFVNPFHGSLCYHPKVPTFARWMVPLWILAAISIFLSGNCSIGASVNLIGTVAGDHIQLPSLFDFGLANSIHDMWHAQVYLLALLIAVLSGAWPYTK